MIKRFIDIVLSSLGIAAIAPFWAVLAVAQRFRDPGPLFYVHRRVGEDGREFDCYKLRTMVVGADRLKQQLMDDSHHDDPRTFKMANDPRVTSLGRFLRRSSLDETPQLINVLLGEMALVGPRPSLPDEVALYSNEERDRLRVKPGITCIWQVSGRSNLAFDQQLELDREYIKSRSTRLDILLLFRTIGAVLKAEGAY